MHLSPSEAHGLMMQRSRDKRSVATDVADVNATTSKVLMATLFYSRKEYSTGDPSFVCDALPATSNVPAASSPLFPQNSAGFLSTPLPVLSPSRAPFE